MNYVTPFKLKPEFTGIICWKEEESCQTSNKESIYSYLFAFDGFQEKEKGLLFGEKLMKKAWKEKKNKGGSEWKRYFYYFFLYI